MSDCKDKKPGCGCEDEELHTPPPCGDGVGCDDPEPCAETFDAQCVIYTGPDIICSGQVIASAGARLSDIVQALAVCSGGGQSTIHRSEPNANEVLSGVDDLVIGIDRNSCFDQIVIVPEAGAPAGLLFNYYDENGVNQVGQPSIIMHPTQSTILCGADISGVADGTYNINLEATACGVTVLIPWTFTAA